MQRKVFCLSEWFLQDNLGSDQWHKCQTGITWNHERLAIDWLCVCIFGLIIPHVIIVRISQIAKFMGPTWGPPGSCRPQIGPMLAPWTLLSGMCISPCYHETQKIKPSAFVCGLLMRSMPYYFSLSACQSVLRYSQFCWCQSSNPNQLIVPSRKCRSFRRWYFQMHVHKWKMFISIQISLKFVPKCPIDNNPALVAIMAWRRVGDTPLSEPILTWFTDAYLRH